VVLQAGIVEQVGTPMELYHYPANLFVAGFIGSPRMNLLPVTVTAADAAGVEVALPSGERLRVPAAAGALRAGEAATLGIRPEALRPDTAGTLAGEVRMVERLGGLTLLHVMAEGAGDITVQVDGDDATQAHQRVRLQVDAAACHLFDGAGLALPHLVRHALVA